jgi:hypothetical protein
MEDERNMRRTLVAIMISVAMVPSLGISESAGLARISQTESEDLLAGEPTGGVANFDGGSFRLASPGDIAGAGARGARTPSFPVQPVASLPSWADNCLLRDRASEEAGGEIRDAAQVLQVSPDQRLSADLDGVSLECVLRELGRQTGITVRVRTDAAYDTVSHKFRDVPLGEGLRSLLRGKSYLLEHAAQTSGGGTGPVAAIHVLSDEPWRAEVRPASRHVAAASIARDADGEKSPEARAADLTELAARNMAKLLAGVLNNPLIEVPGLDRIALADLDEAEWRALMAALANGSADFENLDAQALLDALASGVSSASSVRDMLDMLRGIAEIAQEISLSSMEQARDDPDPRIRQMAREYLDTLSTQSLLDTVMAAVQDREPAVRAAALRTLEEMHEFAPVGEIAAQAMKDADPQVRIVALGLLGYGEKNLAINALTVALDDEDGAVREQAAILLNQLMDKFEQQRASN